MTKARESLIATDIEAYLAAHEGKGMVRFITCGSVSGSGPLGFQMWTAKITEL